MKSASRFSLLGTGISPSTDNAGGVRVKYRHFVSATLFSMAILVYTFYYIAFPLAQLKFTHGYTRFGTPPSPNNFRSDRYTWSWVIIYISSAASLIMVYLLPFAMLNNTVPEISQLHYWWSRATSRATIIIFILLSIIWLSFCNRGFPDYTFCNDLRACCVYYMSSFDGAKWCPNTTPCTPNFTSGDLTRTDDFFQIWLFTLFYSVWALANKSVNKDLRSYGLFREVFTEEETQGNEVE